MQVGLFDRTTKRNGIVKVPPAWIDAVLAAYLAGKGGTIPLPLAGFPYPALAAKLAPIYPAGFVPLYFLLGTSPGVGGSTSTKTQGGYKVALAHGLSARSAASTIHHELRHVVQYLGDETLPQHPKGAFGRPSKAATASLRHTKVLAKMHKAPKGVDPYFTSASEWQPWVGSTADEIVKSLVDHPPKTVTERNKRIAAGIQAGVFYLKTDPKTRREVMSQVYVEVERQLAGSSYSSATVKGKAAPKGPTTAGGIPTTYLDLIGPPKKKPKGGGSWNAVAAPKSAGGFTVGGKVLVAPAAATEMFTFYGITSNEVGTVTSVGKLLGVKFGSKSFKAMLPTLVVPFTPAYLPAPKKAPTAAYTLSIRVKGVKAGDPATNDPTFKGIASQGYARFDLLTASKDAVLALAKTVAAKVDDSCFGGKIVRVRINGPHGESTVYKRPGT